MRCSGCGGVNVLDRRFGAECGAPLVVICPACRFENQPSAKFCGGCAARLGAAAVASPAAPASPESYTPKPLAERILRSRGALEGERKQVTVLFADIKGSMELIHWGEKRGGIAAGFPSCFGPNLVCRKWGMNDVAGNATLSDLLGAQQPT